MACCSKEAMRIILWMAWVTNMIVTTIYYLLSGVTFFKLVTATGTSALDVEHLAMNTVWRAPLAATFLGALLVFGFNMFSCIILVKKSINRSGPGFGYGFLVAFCFTLAFFCLLVGLVMNSFQDVVQDDLQATETNTSTWTKYSTELYTAAQVFAFICFAMFIIFFLALVIFQGAVADHLGVHSEVVNPYQSMADPAAAMGLTAAAGALPSDKNGVGSSSDPAYAAQYNPNDYMTNDAYNNYYNQYQANDAYQTTTEFNANEYAYDHAEQGYQAPYDAAAGYSTLPTNNAAAGMGAATPAYAAPPAYSAVDHNTNAAAAFYGHQASYAAPHAGAAGSFRNEQQL